MVSYKRKNNRHRRAVRKRHRKAEFLRRRRPGRQGPLQRVRTGEEARCVIL